MCKLHQIMHQISVIEMQKKASNKIIIIIINRNKISINTFFSNQMTIRTGMCMAELSENRYKFGS